MSADYELSSDVITENVIKTLESRGVTLKMANEAVIKIQVNIFKSL